MIPGTHAAICTARDPAGEMKPGPRTAATDRLCTNL